VIVKKVTFVTEELAKIILKPILRKSG